jgi:glycosyltransferase involved in cell wall biosynthesis
MKRDPDPVQCISRMNTSIGQVGKPWTMQGNGDLRRSTFAHMQNLAPLRISVIIPVYNAARFVEQAVRSALQFDEVQEVVLVEDGGPDNSLAVCEALAEREPRVKLFRHPGGANLGAGASRNLGIAKATQEFIAFLDADDHYLPTRFDAERVIFVEHPDADGVYGAIAPHYHDETGKEQFRKTFKRELTTVRERVPPEQVFAGLTYSIPDFGYFSLIALTVKRTALMRMDALFRPELRLHQDTEFIVRLAWYARLYAGSIDAPVSMRGVHASNRITQNKRALETRHQLYKCHWEWMLKAGVDKPTVERFHFLYRLKELLAAPSRTDALRKAMAQRQYWHDYDYRDALFERLAGTNDRAKRMLHKLSWKVYGTDPAGGATGPA